MLAFAVRHALRQFANYDGALFDATKARFVGTIIPGQTIETRLWRGEANGGSHLTRIHFECFVRETGRQIISSAFLDLKLPHDSFTPALSPVSALHSSALQQAAAATTTTTDTVPSPPMAPFVRIHSSLWNFTIDNSTFSSSTLSLS